MKNSKKHIARVCCLILMLMLTLTWLTSCGESDNSDVIVDNSEKQESVEQSGQSEEETRKTDSDEIRLSNGRFSVAIPESWQDKYISIIDGQSIQLYQKAAYESFGGGWLCSICEFNDESYKELPDYEVIADGGEINAETDEILNEYTYIVTYPTDVQADLDDEEPTSEYFKMCDQLTQVVKSFSF